MSKLALVRLADHVVNGQRVRTAPSRRFHVVGSIIDQAARNVDLIIDPNPGGGGGFVGVGHSESRISPFSKLQ